MTTSMTTTDETPAYTSDQRTMIARLESDLADHMQERKPKRFAHSLSVARTAESMACAYGVDPFLARCAGTLHDWDKVLSPEEQVAKAERLGIDLKVDMRLVQPLLHGMTAAHTLRERYPELPDEVFRAISLHTVGSAHMDALDEVVFVADGIEPLRPSYPDIERVRSLVDGRRPLDEVYFESFASGVEYVVRTRRYLYPGTIEVYNDLVQARLRTSEDRLQPSSEKLERPAEKEQTS